MKQKSLGAPGRKSNIYAAAFLLTIFLLLCPSVAKAATGEANLGIPGIGTAKMTLSLDSNYALTGQSETVSEVKSSVGEVFRTVIKATLAGSWNPETRRFTGTVNGEKTMNGQYKSGEKVSSRITFTGKLSGMTSSPSLLTGTAEVTITGSNATGRTQVPAPGKVEKGNLSLMITGGQLGFPFEQLHATVGSIVGEVEVSRDGMKTWQPLRPGSQVYEGDFVSTGFDSYAQLVFEIGELVVSPLTNFRIDNLISTKEGFKKTQLNLRVGAVQAKIKNHVANIRSDFAVRTPGTNSSIRGSELRVAAEKDGSTTVYAIEGTTYFTPTNSTKEETLQQGYKIKIAADGSKGTPETYSASEIPAAKTELKPASENAAKTGPKPASETPTVKSGTQPTTETPTIKSRLLRTFSIKNDGKEPVSIDLLPYLAVAVVAGLILMYLRKRKRSR